jgi:hypothetical protein
MTRSTGSLTENFFEDTSTKNESGKVNDESLATGFGSGSF